MKKFLTTVLSLVLIGVSSLGFTACKGVDGTGIDVFVPDGAPALAIAQLLAE